MGLHHGVQLVYNMPQFVICVCGWKLQFQHQPVDLVDADGERNPFLDGMAEKTFGVQHYAFRSVDEEDCACESLYDVSRELNKIELLNFTDSLRI